MRSGGEQGDIAMSPLPDWKLDCAHSRTKTRGKPTGSPRVFVRCVCFYDASPTGRSSFGGRSARVWTSSAVTSTVTVLPRIERIRSTAIRLRVPIDEAIRITSELSCPRLSSSNRSTVPIVSPATPTTFIDWFYPHAIRDCRYLQRTASPVDASRRSIAPVLNTPNALARSTFPRIAMGRTRWPRRTFDRILHAMNVQVALLPESTVPVTVART
jgi:hypothetical protein